jgi:ATP-dependent exoDNAse (exonuclease V) beta subunit
VPAGGCGEAEDLKPNQRPAVADGTQSTKTFDAEVEAVFQNLQDRSRPYRQTTDLTVSDLAEIPGEGRAVFFADSEGREETLLAASSVGHLFHEMLQHTNFGREPADEAGRLIKDFSHRMDAAARPDLEHGLKLFLSSRLADDLRGSERAARPIYRELPFIYRMRAEGREMGSIKGQVDLLFEAPDGKWTLVDYKTTVSEKPEHHRQLQIYAFCLRKLLAGRPHRAALYYTREGLLVPVELTPLDTPKYETDLINCYAEMAERALAE